MVPESAFVDFENYLVMTIEKLVPEELRSTFEFHASALFNGKPPFDKLGHDTAVEILRRCATMVDAGPVPIVYGAVDLRALRRGHFSTAQPLDVALADICSYIILRHLQGKADTEFLYDLIKPQIFASHMDPRT
jgi:hypothetical protein